MKVIYGYINAIVQRMIAFFPIILIIICLADILITYFVIGRSDLTIKSAAIIIPIGISGIYLIKKNRKEPFFIDYIINNVSYLYFTIIYVLLFLISIIFLSISETRTFEYFVIISLMSGIIFLQILCKPTPFNRAIIFFEIALLSLNITWGVAFKYALYYGWTDTLLHLNLIKVMINTGHSFGFGSSYESFPIFHILITTCSELTGLSPKTSLFLMMGLVWQAGLLFSFLIFKYLCKSAHMALIACLLFAFSSQFIFYGFYPVTRSLAFIYLLFLLFLLLRNSKVQLAFNTLIILVTWAMILTHHATTLFVIPILILISLLNIITSKKPEHIFLKPNFIIFFSISFIAYLFWASYEFTKSVSMPWIGDIISAESSAKITTVNSISYLLTYNNLYYAIVIFLALIGIGYIFSDKNYKLKELHLNYIAIACIIFLGLYIPGPLSLIPQAGIALLWRVPLIISPFIALGMAFGVKSLLTINVQSKRHDHVKILTILIVFSLMILTTYLSAISGSNAQDSLDVGPSGEASGFFSSTDLVSFSFTANKFDATTTLYSDYPVVRNQYYLSEFTSKKIIHDGNISNIDDGYLILSIRELNFRNSLIFSSTGNDLGNYAYGLDINNPESNILLQLNRCGMVYDNNGVQTYMIT